MPERKYKIGDTVQLKTGGPLMTVNGFAATGGRLFCVWFVDGENKSATFAPDALIEAEPKPPSQ
jgi:uncharacterized protein YodC (DUF2158 family)